MPEPLGRIKACSECRLQKLKCDASQDYSKPCSRCRRMSLVCEISRSMKKTQRKTKAELARENARLQEQLENSDQLQPQVEQDIRTPSAQSLHASKEVSSPTQSRVGEASSSSIFPSLTTVETSGVEWPRSGSIGLPPGPGSSSVLTIEQVGRRKIDDCFALFFQHYEPFIPGLFDTNASPDRYFEQSVFLFWTIVATGARSYTNDPTLYERIVRQISRIALESLYSMANLIPTIEAVLLLCLWPAPISTMFKDPSHALAGTAMQLAMVNGLHVFGHEQDFVRQSIDCASSKVSLRFRLWVHCVIIFQSTNLIGGFPCWTIPETASLDAHLRLDESVPSYLQYRYHLHRIQTDAIDAITKSTNLTQGECGPPLNSLIDLFDAQVRGSPPPTDIEIALLSQECARLSIKAFHFFAASDMMRTAGLLQLYTIACNVINLSSDRENSYGFAIRCTQYYMRMIVLAAMSILRISRSSMKDHVDIQLGEMAYFKAIALSKKHSTENNDLDSRNATILTQLWTSNTVFYANDGTLRGDQLRLRSRLFMSIMFDTFWHWRATFGGWKSNPYVANGDEPATLLAQNQGLDRIRWGGQSAPAAPLQQWSNPVQTTDVVFENMPAEFSYFPDGDWFNGMSFIDPMNMSMPQFDQQIPVAHDFG